MSLIKDVPYVMGMTPGVPGAPEPRMYPRSGYFLVYTKLHISSPIILFFFRYDFSLLLASNPRHLVIQSKPGNMAGNSREKTNPITELIQHERDLPS